MSKKDEFYVGYLDGVGVTTKKKLRFFVILVLLLVLAGAGIFALSQNTFKNSTFELTQETEIEGIYHESPYPMLKVNLGNKQFKNVILLGFGKSSADPYLKEVKETAGDIMNKKLKIKGNLIYYNGKTFIQIIKPENVLVVNNDVIPLLPLATVGVDIFEGEIIDPKCYFGVMKPGQGKIHRSCAVRCISGGIPPVLATTDDNVISEYFILTDLEGNPINDAVLPFVGKHLRVNGVVKKLEDWYLLKIDTKGIVFTGKTGVYVTNNSCQSDCESLHFKEAFARSH